MNPRYAGKRFASFVLTAALLLTGLIVVIVGDKPELYTSYATALGLALGAYIGGQSSTDWKKASNGGEDNG